MTEKHIRRIRQFNRYYTGVLGLLDKHILHSQYSLPEARVLYELFHHQPCLASDLLDYMDIDKGYLSRILKSFERRGILLRKKNKKDGRASDLFLTPQGKRDFQALDRASAEQLRSLLSSLRVREVRSLTRHMVAIEMILSLRAKKK
jgi:DNA-binding MarR family transcriptional regulator